MQNGQNLPRHFDVILGHVDRFETDQKALTPAPAGTAAPTGPATALASPGTSQTELIRVFYAVLYPDFTHTGQILANCRDVVLLAGSGVRAIPRSAAAAEWGPLVVLPRKKPTVVRATLVP
jgi:hypothetical protein